MIRVTFELLPGGSEDHKRTIGLMEIANVATHLDNTADYAVVLTKTPPFNGALKQAWRKGRLSRNDAMINGATIGEDDEAIVALATGHHRTRRGVYDLLLRALLACGLEARQ
jgi:hypothetical protein